VLHAYILYIVTVYQYFALFQWIEVQQQFRQRRFARAAFPNQRDFLTLFNGYIDIFQNQFSRTVPEIQVFNINVAKQAGRRFFCVVLRFFQRKV
jgi:hypothetical protein